MGTSTCRGSCWYNIPVSTAYSPVQRLDALCRTCPDDARLDWIYTLQVILQLQQHLPSMLSPQSLRVSNPKFSFFLLWNRLLGTAPQHVSSCLRHPIFQLLRFHELLGHPSRFFFTKFQFSEHSSRVFVTNSPTSLISLIFN